MANLLQQLENNEAILLMYLSGELPEPDRYEVEQMLANDVGLRATLAELAALNDEVTGMLGRADAAQVLSRRETVVRRVGRAIAAAKANATVPAAAPTRHRLRVAWWAYPIAAAALFVVAVMLLSDQTRVRMVVTHPDPYHDFPDTVPAAQVAPQYAQIFPDELERELISLKTDDLDLFSAGTPDSDR
jgi:anti-sigma factor RsiW